MLSTSIDQREPNARPIVDPRAAQSPVEGGRVGPYRLLEKIGVGAMGTVYAARDERSRRIVALKILRWSLDARHKQRFLREARLASRVDHPHVLRVFELVDHPPACYLVMEILPGETLRARLDAIRTEGWILPIEYALRVFTALCEGLAAIHRAGVVHRDIKPSNVMVLFGGGVKIVDFGLARQSRRPECAPDLPEDPAESALITEVGSVLGTPGYMAPEQARGREVDARADVFSAGVLLYELLTSKKPFRGHALEAMIAVEQDTPEPPSRHRPSCDPLDPLLDRIVLCCLEKDPRARFTDAGDLLHHLPRDPAPSIRC